MLVDSHAHLEAVEDLEGALKNAQSEGVGKIITIGASLETSKKAVNRAEKYSNKDLKIFASCGVHPLDGKDDIKNGWADKLKSIAISSNKIVGIGECGLDYYSAGDKKQPTTDKDKGFQRELFEKQINLAGELRLPLIVHCRNGWDEIFNILKSNVKHLGASGVFHSWTGDWAAAKVALDLGFYISFSGIVTFGNAQKVQAVAKKTPVDRILVETDSPFLTPEPKRGQKNIPGNVKIIAQFIADLKNRSLDEIASQTSANAQKLFSIL